MRRSGPILAAAVLLVSGAAAAVEAAVPVPPERPDVRALGDRPVSAELAAELFDEACLARLPDFVGAGALFEALGFVGSPAMRMLNHPQKNMSALATTEEDLQASGVRSCAVLVEGLGQSPAAGAVEPLVRARFGAAQRYEVPESGVQHVLWVVETSAGPAHIAVTESDGAAFLGATVLPAPGTPAPAAGRTE